MSLDPINKDVKITSADLPEFDFDLSDSEQKKLEEKASIFVNKKFVPADDDTTIRLVGVGKDAERIIYENVKDGEVHLAKSQSELAEDVINDEAKVSQFFGGFFGNSKSIFGKKKGDTMA